MSRHKDEALGSLHQAYNGQYADSVDRLADVSLAITEIGKFYRQLDDNTIWMLTDESVPTWKFIGGGESLYLPNVTNDAQLKRSADDWDFPHKLAPAIGDKILIEEVTSGAKAWIHSEDFLSSSVGLGPNVVQVDPNQQEVPGVTYHSWVNADTYIQTQTPAVDNLWGILITGNNSEDIVKRPYVTIIGELGVTRLLGTLTSTVAITSTEWEESLIRDCLIQDLELETGKKISFKNCDVHGGTSTGGFVESDGTLFHGGDFSSLDVMILWNSVLYAGIFPETITAYSSVIPEVATLTVNGGSFWNCIVNILTDGSTWNFNTPYFFGDGTINTISRWSIPVGKEVCLILTNMDFDTAPKFQTLGVDNLRTFGVARFIDVIQDVPDGWVNKGVLFDDSNSSFGADNTQDAIDAFKVLFDSHASNHEIGGSDLIEHQSITGKGTNDHDQIDTAITNSTDHIADTDNPHETTKTHVGLGNVTDDSQLKRADNDWSGYSEQSTDMVTGDKLLIEDAATGAKKWFDGVKLRNKSDVKSAFFLGDIATVVGAYRVRNLTGNAAFIYSWSVPYDFVSLENIYLVGWCSALVTGGIVDINSDYAAIGEDFQTHQESDTLTGLNLVADQMYGFDLSSIYSNLSAKDLCGLRFDPDTGFTPSTRFLGIYLEYK